MVITGASAGIGAAAAVELTRQGHHVVAVGRSETKLAAVHRRMRAVAPARLDVPAPVAVDLASLREVRRLAAIVLDRCPRLDVLANNAGVQPVRRRLSADGFELALAVNHLAPFLLTNLLIERLRASGGRIITTSSSNHADGAFDWSDPHMERGWTSGAAYDRSKLANVLFTVGLRERTGLPASSFHPGSIRTDLNRDSPFFRVSHVIERFVYGRPEQGADTLVWLSTSTEGAAPTAAYYVDRAPAPVAPRAADPDHVERLWELSARLVGLPECGAARGADS